MAEWLKAYTDECSRLRATTGSNPVGGAKRINMNIERKRPEEIAALIADYPNMMGFGNKGKSADPARKLTHKEMLSRHKAKKRRK